MANDDPIETPAFALQTVALFCCALVLLAAFQSSALVTLSYDLPAFSGSETFVSAAEQWHSAMQKVGAASVTEAISSQLEEWRAVLFDG